MKQIYGDSVTFKDVKKIYNETIAVSDFNLEIKESEFITLLGPSGSGKTTVLNMIAGFISQNSGSIKIGKNSVVGAGSAITKNVKNKSLSLTRAKQVEINNYKKK